MMPERAKIIQDLSLLYELSLSIGSSLEVQANSLNFFRTLMQRKSLTFAALWLYRQDHQVYELACAQPTFRVEETTMSKKHPLLVHLAEQSFFATTDQEKIFPDLIQEKQISKGVYLIYRLGDIGFVKLYANNRTNGVPQMELEQLQGVMDKFKVSLEACLAFERYQQEAAQRLEAQQQAELSNTRLRESELKLRRIIDSSLDAVITIDEAGIITEWGRQTVNIFGYSRSEALGRSLGDLIVPERFREAHARGMNHFLATGEGPVLNQLLELVGQHKDGHEFPIEISITAVKAENNYFFSSFIRDITERKKIEKALRQSEEKYRGIIENMELGLLEVDVEGKVVRAFDRFCTMTGYSNEDLVGKQAEDILLPEKYQAFLKQQNNDRKEGKAGIYEIELLRKDGSLIWVLISGAPIYDGDGEMVGSLGIHYDITDRKRLEGALQKARQVAEQARAAEQQFLANMSHEIRTPMNTVIGMTHLLYETNPNATQREYLHALRFSADSLMGVIDNILDMSKIEAGKLEFESRPFNLRELLVSLRRTFQFRVREKPISVDIEVDPKIKNLVIGDPNRLNQILTNLLSNASKFTEQGIIGVVAHLREQDADKYVVEFRVHDTGIGIPADKLGVIFENFKQADVKITRKYGGTGLGLTIVKQLVELQGGSIRAESTPGTGSLFVVVLPLGKTSALATEKQENTGELVQQRKAIISNLRVLVVEDNPMNQKLIKKILDLWEVSYDVVDDGQKAVLSTRDEKFDLILMDIHMPEMDGFTATRTIRSQADNPNNNTPIIALTAAALVTEKEEAFRSGMNDFLTKPFAPQQLEDMILKALAVDLPLLSPSDATAQMTGAVSIDLTYLQEFSGGDRIFIRDMIETFLVETPTCIHDLKNSLKNAEWSEAYKIVHRLKPNLMMLGMHPQQELAARIESAIKQEDFVAAELEEEVADLCLAIEASFSLLQQELQAL